MAQGIDPRGGLEFTAQGIDPRDGSADKEGLRLTRAPTGNNRFSASFARMYRLNINHEYPCILQIEVQTITQWYNLAINKTRVV